MSRLLLAVATSLIVIGLSACGDTAADRAISGGLIGAGVGAGLGAVTTPQHHQQYQTYPPHQYYRY